MLARASMPEAATCAYGLLRFRSAPQPRTPHRKAGDPADPRPPCRGPRRGRAAPTGLAREPRPAADPGPQPAPSGARSRGPGRARSAGGAAAEIQPDARGARPLPCRAQGCPARDRRPAARGQHQPGPAVELADAGGGLSAERRCGQRRRRGVPRGEAEVAAAADRDRHLAVRRRRTGSRRANHPRLPAHPRRPPRGHAASGSHRHGQGRPGRRRDAAGGGDGAVART